MLVMISRKLVTAFVLLGLPVPGYSADFSPKKNLDLLLPEKKITEKSYMESVPYQVQLPGEFVDVDLPDDIKKAKHIHFSEINQSESGIANENESQRSLLSIQVAVFKNKKNAMRLKEKLLLQHLRVFIVEKKNHNNALRYHVRFGQYASRRQAEKALINFKNTVDTNAFIVTE